MDEKMLRGWDAIEAYLGLTRKTILARGYPVRKDGGVFAFKGELDEAALGRPLVRPGNGGAERPANSRLFPDSPIGSGTGAGI